MTVRIPFYDCHKPRSCCEMPLQLHHVFPNSRCMDFCIGSAADVFFHTYSALPHSAMMAASYAFCSCFKIGPGVPSLIVCPSTFKTALHSVFVSATMTSSAAYSSSSVKLPSRNGICSCSHSASSIFFVVLGRISSFSTCVSIQPS